MTSVSGGSAHQWVRRRAASLWSARASEAQRTPPRLVVPGWVRCWRDAGPHTLWLAGGAWGGTESKSRPSGSISVLLPHCVIVLCNDCCGPAFPRRQRRLSEMARPVADDGAPRSARHAPHQLLARAATHSSGTSACSPAASTLLATSPRPVFQAFCVRAMLRDRRVTERWEARSSCYTTIAPEDLEQLVDLGVAGIQRSLQYHLSKDAADGPLVDWRRVLL